MKDMFKSFIKFIGFNYFQKGKFYSFYVGKIYFVIFDFSLEKGVVFDKIIEQILINNLDFYWFRSYFELENYIDIFNTLDSGCIFIIIG